MAKPRPCPVLGAGVEHPLADHALFAYVRELVEGTLRYYGVPVSERDDLIQDVVLDGLRKRDTYRAEAGTPAQWLNGIARNHARVYWRKLARRPKPTGELADPPSEAPTPEDTVAKERLLSILSPAQRKAVMFHDDLGLTYREMADAMKISKSKAERLYKSAITALRERDERSAGIVPLFAGALFDEDPTTGLSPEAAARGWDRVAAEGLVDDLVDLVADLEGPPSSGPRPRDVRTAPPPGPRPSPRVARLSGRWGRRGSRGLFVAAGLLIVAKLAPEDGRPIPVAVLVAVPPTIHAPEAPHLDAEAPAPPSPPARAARTPPPSRSAEALAVPHYPDRLAQVRKRLWSARCAQHLAAGEALPETCATEAAPRGADVTP